jgi:hypothetical protein
MPVLTSQNLPPDSVSAAAWKNLDSLYGLYIDWQWSGLYGLAVIILKGGIFPPGKLYSHCICNIEIDVS